MMLHLITLMIHLLLQPLALASSMGTMARALLLAMGIAYATVSGNKPKQLLHRCKNLFVTHRNPTIHFRLNSHSNLHSNFYSKPNPDNSNIVSLVVPSKVVNVGGTSSVSSSIFNLSKTILGAGVLSLPFGIAAIGDRYEALVPATFLLVLMGIISSYTFASIGRACANHNAKSMAEAWEKLVDAKTSVALTFIVLFKTFFACLAYTIIIGDSFSSILQGLPHLVPTQFAQRIPVILTTTFSVLLPLCSLKQLDALKYTSILGLGGIVYTALFMCIRCFDRSYASSGTFALDIAKKMRPVFNQRSGSVINPMLFILISLMSTAYVPHFNAPKFWVELKNPSLPKYYQVVASAFAFAIFIYTFVSWMGFLTFGGNVSGMILNNYSKHDVLATFSRIAIGLGIVCTYPLAFATLRDSIFDLFRTPEAARTKQFMPITLLLFSVVTGLAMVVSNVGKVVSLSGAIIGSLLNYIIPGVLNIRQYQWDREHYPEKEVTKLMKGELYVNYLLVLMGCVFGVTGVTLVLKPPSVCLK